MSGSSMYIYSEPDRSWKAKVYLYEYTTPYHVAGAALYGIWLFLLVGVALWAGVAKKARSNASLSTSGAYKFWIGIVLAIVCYIFLFSYKVLEQEHTTVTEAYVLVLTIFDNFNFPAEILLLAAIFSLLFRATQQPDTGHQRHRGLLWCHYVFCGVLFVFYIAIFGRYVHDLKCLVINGEDDIYFVHDRPIQYVLEVVYDVLYAGASLEVFVWSTSLLINRHKYLTNNTNPILLLAFIAIPLLISRFFILGFNIAYEIAFTTYFTRGLGIIYILMSGLSLVIPFAGLVVLSLQQRERTEKHYDTENRVLQGEYAPSHAAPSGEPYSHVMYADRGARGGRIARLKEWRPQLPNFRKGGKSGLGLKMAF